MFKPIIWVDLGGVRVNERRKKSARTEGEKEREGEWGEGRQPRAEEAKREKKHLIEPFKQASTTLQTQRDKVFRQTLNLVASESVTCIIGLNEAQGPKEVFLFHRIKLILDEPPKNVADFWGDPIVCEEEPWGTSGAKRTLMQSVPNICHCKQFWRRGEGREGEGGRRKSKGKKQEKEKHLAQNPKSLSKVETVCSNRFCSLLSMKPFFLPFLNVIPRGRNEENPRRKRVMQVGNMCGK